MPAQSTDLVMIERSGVLHRTTAGDVAGLGGGGAGYAIGFEQEFSVGSSPGPGFVLMDGRDISTLTATQQAAASGLGWYSTGFVPDETTGRTIITRETGVSISGATIDYTKVRGKRMIEYLITETSSNSGTETFTFPEGFIEVPCVTSAAYAGNLNLGRSVIVDPSATQVAWSTRNTRTEGGSGVKAMLHVEGRAASSDRLPDVYIYLGA